MDITLLLNQLKSDFYTGVPDSQLKALCDYLMNNVGISDDHIIAANEGNSVALAAGYYLATGKIPVVYMQNSGIGNIINPVASLLNEKVYGIPCIFIIGWRGEPGVHDEPQHIFQGEISQKLLEDIGLHVIILSKDTSEKELEEELAGVWPVLARGKSVAFLVRKKALVYEDKVIYKNSCKMLREKVIEHVAEAAREDVIISTTGKASRELYEIRDRKGQGHQQDFLTVGSMGHASSIALGIAIKKPGLKVWCIDGDGAVLMHMGAMAVIGSRRPSNMVHIIINNEAHETVGGMPTATVAVDMKKIAEGCGYPFFVTVNTYEELDRALLETKSRDALTLIEARCAIGSRANLGRPVTSAQENKNVFMEYLRCAKENK